MQGVSIGKHSHLLLLILRSVLRLGEVGGSICSHAISSLYVTVIYLKLAHTSPFSSSLPVPPFLPLFTRFCIIIPITESGSFKTLQITVLQKSAEKPQQFQQLHWKFYNMNKLFNVTLLIILGPWTWRILCHSHAFVLYTNEVTVITTQILYT